MIVATAGHVDHGKTSLVRMLTGMETDRLAEEKRRGLSIDLGFAYRRTGTGSTIAFIDVPGHNRFINNMIAGISGIDLGLLVVAADDGPMPQTREHMDILRLLGVRRLLLVISKIDRVDEARLQAVRKSALALFPDAAQTPVFEVATLAGQGVEALADFLGKEAGKFAARPVQGHFRLSIDRAFLLKGTGLVVTGTIASGKVSVGDSLVLLPQNRNVRVRSLQVQETQTQTAQTGQRCALNISGVERQDIERGDWLVSSAANRSTRHLDACVEMLVHAPFALKHMAPVRLHIGAKKTRARLILLGERMLVHGQRGLARLLVDRPLHCCHGDRFLLRDDSESVTLAGGTVLDPSPPTQRVDRESRREVLAAMTGNTAAQVLQTLLFEHRQLIDLGAFCLGWNIRADEAAERLLLSDLEARVTVFDQQGTRYIVETKHWQVLAKKVQADLKDAGGPLPLHLLKQKLKQACPGCNPDPLIVALQTAGTITLGRDRVSLVKQEAEIPAELGALWSRVEACLEKSGPAVPALGDLQTTLACAPTAMMELVRWGIKTRRLVLIADKRLLLTQQLGEFARQARLLADRQDAFSVAEFKNACGIGRNLAVEVLEYFDKIGFTLRKGSGRVILQADKVATTTN